MKRRDPGREQEEKGMKTPENKGTDSYGSAKLSRALQDAGLHKIRINSTFVHLLLKNIFTMAGGVIKKWDPTGKAGGSPYAPVRLHYQPRPSRRIFGLTFAFLLLATRKRVSWYRKF